MSKIKVWGASTLNALTVKVEAIKEAADPRAEVTAVEKAGEIENAAIIKVEEIKAGGVKAEQVAILGNCYLVYEGTLISHWNLIFKDKIGHWNFISSDVVHHISRVRKIKTIRLPILFPKILQPKHHKQKWILAKLRSDPQFGFLPCRANPQRKFVKNCRDFTVKAPHRIAQLLVDRVLKMNHDQGDQFL